MNNFLNTYLLVVSLALNLSRSGSGCTLANSYRGGNNALSQQSPTWRHGGGRARPLDTWHSQVGRAGLRQRRQRKELYRRRAHVFRPRRRRGASHPWHIVYLSVASGVTFPEDPL